MSNWILHSAKTIGRDHVRSNIVCQDDVKTLEKNGTPIKIVPTKQNIEKVMKGNKIRVNAKNINNVVNDMVEQSQRITKEHARDIKQKMKETADKLNKQIDVRSIKKIQNIDNQSLADIIATIYDEDGADARDEVLAAYGY